MIFRKLIGAFLVLSAVVFSSPAAQAYTIYFVNTLPGGDGWGENYSAHIWDAYKVSYTSWANHVPLEYSGKLAEINGTMFPVYTLEFEWDKTPVGILFSQRRQSNWRLSIRRWEVLRLQRRGNNRDSDELSGLYSSDLYRLSR